MKRLKLTTSKNSIRRGLQQDPDCCPISLTVNKCLKKGFTASVESNGRIFVSSQDLEFTYETKPVRARERFIKKYDSGVPKSQIKPLSFSVELPEEVLKPSYLK